MSGTERSPEPEVLVKLDSHLIKSNFFRVIHVDGAWGGISPNGRYIQMAVYSERVPIPQKQVQPVIDGHALGQPIASEGITKQGVVREIESVLTFDLVVARAIQEWLGQKIELLEKVESQTK